MWCVAIEVLVIKTMRNHCYMFEGRIYRQEEGGSIGLDLTGVVADIYMSWWDGRLMILLREAQLSTTLYKRYVDDINMVLKMGPLDKMLGMLPGGMADMIPKGREGESEGRIKGYMTMMDSMTNDELDGIDKNKSKGKKNGKAQVLKWEMGRLERVARGSGHSIRDVDLLLNENKRMAKVMGKMKGMKIGKNGDIDMGRNMPKQMSEMLTQMNPAFAKMGGEAGMKKMLQQLQNGGMGDAFPGMNF